VIAVWLLAVLSQAPDVCLVELPNLEIRSPELQQALLAEGVALNRSPSELDSLTLEISLYADNGVKFRTLQKQIWSKVLPRKGVEILIKEAPLGTIRLASFRVKVAYRVEGKDFAFEFEGLRLRSGKLYEDPEGGTRIGIAGIRTVAGSYRTQGKQQVYSGDVLFLRLRVEGLDEKARPEGTLEIVPTIGGKKHAPIARTIQASHWKVDGSKFPSNDADPKMMGYDATAREFLVGFLRVEEERKIPKLGLEVKFAWKKQVWTWTLPEAPFVEAPRPPDAK
jgi:hypothetical protein